MDFFAGTMAGISITLTGHPFEQPLISTIKVRMQAGQVTSMLDCFKRTYRSDGLKGFMYGLSSPLVSIPLQNAVSFAAYAHANKYIGQQKSFFTGLIAGSYAGFWNALICTPIQLIKCRLQIQSKDKLIGRQAQYSGLFDCIRQIYLQNGIKSFYKGGVITVFREVPGMAAQFASYQAIKSAFSYLLGTDEHSTLTLFVCGNFAGFNCWFWCYPQDVVKTQLQVQESSYKRKSWDGGAVEVTKSIYKTRGLGGFFKGFSACSLRATIPNGFGFLTYEMIMSYHNNRNNSKTY